MRFFRAPYTSVYIAFPRPCALRSTIRATDLHELEGACRRPRGAAHHVLHEHKTRGACNAAGSRGDRRSDRADLHRLADRQALCAGRCLAGRDPIHQDEDQVSDAPCSPGTMPLPAAPLAGAGVLPPLPVEIACAAAAISGAGQGAAVPEPARRQRRVTEHGPGEAPTGVSGPKKAAKIGRKLTTAYDRILIGPSANRIGAGSGAGRIAARDDRHVKSRIGAAGTSGRFLYGEGVGGESAGVDSAGGECEIDRESARQGEDEAVCGALTRHLRFSGLGPSCRLL